MYVGELRLSTETSGGEEAPAGGERAGAPPDGHAEQGLRPPAQGPPRPRAGATALKVRDATDGTELHLRAHGLALIVMMVV